MEILDDSNFNKYNIYGLKEICRYNRDIFICYNSLLRDELINYIKSKLNNKYKIKIPLFINNDSRCIAKYKIKISYI